MPTETATYLLNAHWQAAASYRLPTAQSDWLLETDSLTARLKSRCQHFRVQLLHEQLYPLPAQLHQCLPASGPAMLREVVLWCDEVAVIYAQSWLPQPTLQTVAPLAQLGEQPLGEFIFRHPALVRQPLQLAQLDSRQLGLGDICPPAPLWARRSVFQLAEQPLLVAEVFLPGVYPL
ncbi:chorismate lyase [Alkalimonas delamerensis]|uniref:Probable chorismate pyruvate-lyase n=1 Tax=Alkalimonas delamerensis TaxID=265981 RepID=A0ABT9GLB2_9GAMM|nr:chorismate lyase [Alkalimonas delamerensis]MDP4527753.1 chorismate lyase [Alkalimonas delamerensis]